MGEGTTAGARGGAMRGGEAGRETTVGLRERGWRMLARVDGWFNRLYGWRYNPLYQSGTLVVLFLVITLVTGLYLLFFYRIGAPYASVEAITAQWWGGRWIRTLHRYASDAMLVATALHVVRLVLQKRSWGPRALAWVSGLVMLGVILVSGWTGYVMVWDVQGYVLAVEGARLLDVLPIFSEPITRAFTGEEALPRAFFFLNLFLHVALPLGIGLLLWLHVSRVARPVLWPPRALALAATALLLGLSLLWPAAMGPEADPLRLPPEAPYDWFYSFWLPAARALPAWAVWLGAGALSAVLLAVPWWTRPRGTARPVPSVVEERYCTGCEQCYLDCPYEAISMLRLPGEPARLVARVDPSLCVSCGICAGSCAPMGVGPPGRTGRDQLAEARAFVAANLAAGAAPVVVVACARGAGGLAEAGVPAGATVYGVDCVGSVHTSVIERFLRDGAPGVLLLSCHPRDCWNREGARWLEERVYHDREAELQARVDRRRVRLAYAGWGERRDALAALAAFRADLAELELRDADAETDLIRECHDEEEDITMEPANR